MKHQIQQPVSPKYTVSSSLVLKNQEIGSSITSGYYHTGDNQTQLYKVYMHKFTWQLCLLVRNYFSMFHNSGKKPPPLLSLSWHTSLGLLVTGAVFPKYLLSFLGNFSTLLVLKPWFLVVKEKRIS